VHSGRQQLVNKEEEARKVMLFPIHPAIRFIAVLRLHLFVFAPLCSALVGVPCPCMQG